MRSGAGVTAARGLDIELEVQGNRTDGLVLGEYYFQTPPVGEPGAGYSFAGFLEIYNNSDRTIFLDGKMIVKGFRFGARGWPSRPCAVTRQGANDPEGVWGHWFQQFPGGGGEFPLGPGETAVVATDAIDHREVAAVYPDLRGADFEFTGSGDVDNPDVPNMVDNGVEEWFLGHGLWFQALAVTVLVDRVEIGGLPRARINPQTDRGYVRFPAAAVSDVFATDFQLSSSESEFCREMVHADFDRLNHLLPEGTSRNPGPRFSQQRRVVGTAPGGWPILLDTNTSAVDFVLAPYTPGTLPSP